MVVSDKEKHGINSYVDKIEGVECKWTNAEASKENWVISEVY